MVKKKIKIKKGNLLIVDDEKSLRDSIKLVLEDSFNIFQAKSGKQAIDIVKKTPIDVVLLDIRMPEIDGLEVLKLIKKIDETIEVIMVTAIVMVKQAVEAIRSGAYDYITKPFDVTVLSEQVAKAMEKRTLSLENSSLRRLITQDFQFEKIVGKSRVMLDIFKTIETVAKSNATVLITGESGTGKELVAHAIHNLSGRQGKLFVPVNCGAIPENLIESELFGHERGSFTGATERQVGKFEIANGGTIFLDEIGSMPMAMQSKLLRVLQNKEIERIGAGYSLPIDVRIISATNSDLKQSIKKYKFREDLYYRLNVIPIHLPPLRERKEDIPLLANYFLDKSSRQFNKKITGFEQGVLNYFINYEWPGNIRELQNLIERLVVLAQTDLISQQQLPLELCGQAPSSLDPHEIKFYNAVKKFEAEFIKKALDKAGGRKTHAARLLGVHRNTLTNLEKKLDLN